MHGHDRRGPPGTFTLPRFLLFAALFTAACALLIAASIGISWSAEWAFGLPHRPIW